MADIIVNTVDNAATINANANGTAIVRPKNNGSRAIKHVCFLVVLGAAPTGTAPTLTYKLQSSLDGTNWFDVASTSALNTNGQTARLEAECVESYWRVTKTVGGSASPTFTLVTSYICFR